MLPLAPVTANVMVRCSGICLVIADSLGSPLYAARKYFILNKIRGELCAKYVQAQGLRPNSSKQRTYGNSFLSFKKNMAQRVAGPVFS
jgi:hypothetical protein